LDQVDLNVELRTESGSAAARRLRRKGLIPANLHGINHKEAKSLVFKARDFVHATHTEAGGNVIFNLCIEGAKGGKAETAVIKEIQNDPIKGILRHIDFQKISLKEHISVPVPIHLQGMAIGVKEGGVLDHQLHNINIDALPLDIPEHIDIDVSQLKIGDAIHVADLHLSEKLVIKEKPDTVVVMVSHHAPVAETEETAETGEASVEPTVIGKGKEEEES